jgi:NAD-dependent SIR2 family protein deacetylase
MATYHGLEHLECLRCGWQTREDEHIEEINDLSGYCPECESQFFLWSSEDGEQMVTSGVWRAGERLEGTFGSFGWHRLRQGW